jgi:DNA-binding NarL/FixJ family response regulator
MPLTIVVADDDPGTRLSVSDYLDLSGYSVLPAENGQDALELVNRYQPHLIVTDITMPQMDGYELIRLVRRQPAFRLLPVVFLTARTETKERIRGYQLGCDAYLPKPFELEELGAVIRNLLERSQIMEADWRVRRMVSDAPDLPPGEPTSSPQAKPEPEAVSPPLASPSSFGLTGREQDVLSVLVKGLSNVQIGDRLHLSPRTVEKYVSSLLRKTDTSNRAELVRFAMDHHLVR